MTEEPKEARTEETETTPTEEAHAERRLRLPKFEFHRLPGADSIGELIENQMAHLKSLYEEWEKLETDNKGKIDHGIDEMARLAHVAVDSSLDFIGKVRKNTLDWLEQGASRLRTH